jgi:hypothetical protein
LLHDVEGIVDLAQSLAVRDELVDLQLTLQIVLYQTGQLRSTLDTTERATLPLPAGDKLEC